MASTETTTTRPRTSAAITCSACGRAVGVVWYGAEPQLVDRRPVAVEGPRGTGLALMIHQCPERGQQIPAPTARQDLGPVRKGGRR